MKKIMLGSFIILFACAIVFLFLSRDFWIEKYMTQKYLAEFAALDEAYRRDNFGGATPEETLEMFITALESEDAKLASSYFVPEKRKEIKEDIEAGLKSGGVSSLILDIQKEKIKKCHEDTPVCIFTTFDKDNIAEFSFKLVLNKYSQKWLIQNL